MKKIIGIGNALIDTLLQLDNEDMIQELGLSKGGMVLIDKEKHAEITKKISNFDKKMAFGGSAANTIHGLANLNVPAAYIGKTGKDPAGDFFREDLVKNNIVPRLVQSATPTGEAIALITPDAERTFATYLGAAVELSEDDIQESFFDGYDILHIEGYLAYNQPLMIKSAEIAKKKGMEISMDMASFNVIEDNYDFLREYLNKYVDIVFANEEEAKALTGKEPEDALEEIASMAKIAVVKLGKNGSMVKKGNKKVTVQAKTANSIDTTGAGDSYAAGFLYGLVNGYDLEKSANTGSILSARIVERMGPKMGKNDWREIRSEINTL